MVAQEHTCLPGVHAGAVRKGKNNPFRLLHQDGAVSSAPVGAGCHASPPRWMASRHTTPWVRGTFPNWSFDRLSFSSIGIVIMKKTILLASLLAAIALTACGKKEEAPVAAPAPAAEPAPAAAPSMAGAAESAKEAGASAVDAAKEAGAATVDAAKEAGAATADAAKAAGTATADAAKDVADKAKEAAADAKAAVTK